MTDRRADARRLAAAATLLSVLLSACSGAANGTIVGSGVSRTDDRSAAPFTSVRVGTAVIADVTLGSPASVRVTADDNVLGQVRTDVSGSRLDVHLDGNVTLKSPVRVAITVPSLEAVSADSAGQVHVVGLDRPSLSISGDSSGRVDVSGRVETLTADGRAAAQLLLGSLVASRADVHLDSAAVATLDVRGTVSGRVSAGGVLRVAGGASTAQVVTETGGVVVHE